VLNIRVTDIHWSSNQLVIARRADEKDDTRLDQPLVKTLDRRLVMKDTLAADFHKYITKYRNKVPNACYNEYAQSRIRLAQRRANLCRSLPTRS
jgi:hypothetical protein